MQGRTLTKRHAFVHIFVYYKRIAAHALKWIGIVLRSAARSNEKEASAFRFTVFFNRVFSSC